MLQMKPHTPLLIFTGSLDFDSRFYLRSIPPSNNTAISIFFHTFCFLFVSSRFITTSYSRSFLISIAFTITLLLRLFGLKTFYIRSYSFVSL